MTAAILGRPDIILIPHRDGSIEEWEVCARCRTHDERDPLVPCADCSVSFHPWHLNAETALCAGCTEDARVQEQADIAIGATPWIVVSTNGIALAECRRCPAFLGMPCLPMAWHNFSMHIAKFLGEHSHCTEVEA